ncbi:hypothetical protein [Bacteroides heparinolyticus]|uniref:hypothetical protein n=1 Tax=Prevotella heparinolytica TaxID=28113 RepID=UPI00359F7581
MGASAVAYSTTFHGVKGTEWRIDILIEDYAGTVQYLPLCADDGAVIEWAESDQTGVVQSSRLTLRCVSETDRAVFNTLVTSTGRKTAVVFMDKKEYWRGTLDDEIYEEPYSYSRNYEVEITFSDFGILNFIPYIGDDAFLTVRQVVALAMQEAGLGNLPVDIRSAFRTVPSNPFLPILPLDFDTVSIMPRRITDEEDGAFGMTMLRDILEEVLKPFALRIVQRCGAIWLYDIDSLYDYPSVIRIAWHDDDGWLETGKKAGSVKVTFDPAAKRDVIDGIIYPEWLNLLWGDRYINAYTIEPIFEGGNLVGMNIVEGFKIQHTRFLIGDAKCSVELLDASCAFFRMLPICEGEECAGVAWNYITADSENGYNEIWMMNNPLRRLMPDNTELFRTKKMFLPHCSEADRKNYSLRLSMDILVDTRFDPFGKEPEPGNSQYFAFRIVQENIHFVYIPVILNIIDSEGNAKWHYENNVAPGSWIHDQSRCCWKPGSGQFGKMWLCYYGDDRNGKSPFCHGWTGNRMNIDSYYGDLPPMWDAAGSGEFIPLPPEGGFLQLLVGSALVIPSSGSLQYVGLVNQQPSPFKWQLYRNLMITLVPNQGKGEIKTENVVESDWFGMNGTISIETKYGTKTHGVAPSATGLIMSGTLPAQGFYKNGSFQTLESHLRYLIASQYGNGNGIVLSGTADLIKFFGPLEDVIIKVRMMMLSDRQNLIEETSEARMAQIWPARQLYSYAWSDDVCVLERERFFFAWSDDVCVKFDNTPLQYMFAWSDDICVKEQNIASDTYHFAWSDDVCVKVQETTYSFIWGTYVCVTDRTGSNTGKKRARFVTITPTGGTPKNHGIENAFTDPATGTSYPLLGFGKINLSNLNATDYAARLDAFANYVYSQHQGLQANCPNLTTGAELTDTAMCPIGKNNFKTP